MLGNLQRPATQGFSSPQPRIVWRLGRTGGSLQRVKLLPSSLRGEQVSYLAFLNLHIVDAAVKVGKGQAARTVRERERTSSTITATITHHTFLSASKPLTFSHHCQQNVTKVNKATYIPIDNMSAPAAPNTSQGTIQSAPCNNTRGGLCTYSRSGSSSHSQTLTTVPALTWQPHAHSGDLQNSQRPPYRHDRPRQRPNHWRHN